MNTEFFQAKKPWSKYKDSILRYYLQPYMAKVARLRKPIVIVDCCAGRGRFDDGEEGSPLIICDAIKHWRDKGKRVFGQFIEDDVDNFSALERELDPYQAFASLNHGLFEDHLADLASRAKKETVFLYIDPYTVKSLVFDRMKSVFDQIHEADASVEVLMNFNVATFMRWGLAAIETVGGVAARRNW